MAVDFYHGQGSPYSWRVWLALEYLEIPYNLKVLSFAAGDTRKPEFMALNPRHQVPTIVDDGFVIWESTVILEYLDERFASGKRLYPGDARGRARIRRLIRESEEYLNLEGVDPITTEYFSKDGAAPDMAVVDKARGRLREELERFAAELQGDYLAGAAPSAADFVVYPWVAYVKRVTVRKPETKLDKTFPPHWRA
jgi:glutathione S-transferase